MKTRPPVRPVAGFRRPTVRSLVAAVAAFLATAPSQASEILLTPATTDFVIWTGTGNLGNGWDTTTQNWKLSSNNAPTTYFNRPADAVVFDDSASASNTSVGIGAADVSPLSVTFNNSTRDYFVQGIFGIAGTTGVTKTGTGKVTISAANSYTGPTTITQGVLKAGHASALGNPASGITVASGGGLDTNGQALQGYTQQITISGAGSPGAPTLGALGNHGVTNLNSVRGISLAGPASIGGDGGRWDIGRIDFHADPAIAVDHIAGNGFVLTKVGLGYLGLLTGATNLAGFIIDGGTVGPHENTSFGTGPVTISHGAILQPWGTNITFANPFTINDGTIQNDGHTNFFNSSITVAGPAVFNARAGGDLVFNGNVTGAGAVNKIGPLSVFLNGDNSGLTGSYTNSESNTFFGAATGGSASAAFVVNGGKLAGRVAGTSTVNLGSLAGLGGQVGNAMVASAVVFRIGGNGSDTTFSGAIVNTVGSGGTTGITKVGGGALTLNGPLTYTDVTTISAGTLKVNSALGTGTNSVNASGGTTKFGVSQTLAALNIGAGAIVVLDAVPPSPFAAAGTDGGVVQVTGGSAENFVEVVPEPGSIALLFGGIATLLGRRRRRG